MAKNMLGMELREWNSLSGLSDPYSLELARISAEAGVPHVLSEQAAPNPSGQTGRRKPAATDTPAMDEPKAQTTKGDLTPDPVPSFGKEMSRLVPKSTKKNPIGSMKRFALGSAQTASGLVKGAKGVVGGITNFFKGAKEGYRQKRAQHATESLLRVWQVFLGENGLEPSAYLAVVEEATARGDRDLLEGVATLDEMFMHWCRARLSEMSSQRPLGALVEEIRREASR